MSDHPICHIEIPATDPVAVGKFYAELFDWKIEADPALNYHMFQPQRGPGGAFVEMGEMTGARIGQVLIYVSTDDIDATLAHAEALGAKTLTPKTEGPYGWSAVFADPAGNRIALYTEPSHSWNGGASMTTQNHPATPVESGYVPVDGLEMYFEIYGSGQPLVLLHGNLSTIGTSFGKVLPTLASTRRIIAVEQQGHGHTADIDRPFSLEQWAQDTTALLRHLGIEQADFFGYSSGGAVTLEIALRSPALVRKLIIAGGTSYRRDGFYPELLKAGETMKPEDLDGSPFQQEYARIAPHPEQWHRLVAKITDLDHTIGDRSREAIASVKAPTLLIIGDSDIVRPEHVVEMFRLLGGGVVGDLVGLPRSQLAVLPGTTHVTLVDRAEWLASMITAFLEAPMPETVEGK